MDDTDCNMKYNYDPKHIDFDPYRCWNDGDCDCVDEECFGDPNDEDFEEILFCGAPTSFECPLLKKVNKHLKI